jgi:hypothetical protein
LTDNKEPSNSGADLAAPRLIRVQLEERFFDLKFSHWVEIILTIALVVIGGFQFVVYSRQAEIMEAQDRTARTAQRPWVSFGSPHAASAFPVGDKGGSFSVDYTLKNYGNSPALNVEIDAELPMLKSKLDFLAVQEAICKRVKERPIGDKGNGLTIFPQEAVSQRVNISIQPGAVSKGIESLGTATIPPPNRLFAPMMIGCVRYVYSADMSQHETGFVFNVSHLPPMGILSADKGDIPAEEILLINLLSGSSRTN